MPLVIGDEVVDCSKIFYNRSKGRRYAIVQVVIDDPDPDDGRYIDIISSDRIAVLDDIVRYDFKANPNEAMYYVKYDEEGHSQVTVNFSVID